MIGALCLNPAGLADFNNRPIISRFFKIFSSEKHVRILQDRDNGNMIGASFDELIRHHPTLKDKVMEATMEALAAIRDQGRAFVPEKDGEGYNLQFDVEPTLVDTNMDSTPAAPVVPAVPVVETPPKIEVKENHVLTCIDVMGRVSSLAARI